MAKIKKIKRLIYGPRAFRLRKKLSRTVHGDGTQHICRFPNGYGASVVCHSFSYGGTDGLWELAVLQFDGPNLDDFQLVYDTSITNDVIGRMNPKEVWETLHKIRALEKRPTKGE